MPVGVAFALAFGTRRAILLAFLLSLAVESAQLWLPGRHAALADLASNTTGAAIGITLLLLRGHLLRPTRRHAFGLAAGWATMAIAALAIGSALLQPALPPTVWWGQWTPALDRTEQYRGRVVSAHIGDLALPSERLGSSDSVRALLARGIGIEVVAIAGPPPGSPAPIFSMADEHPREILMIGASGRDLVFRVRRRSADYLLDRPDLRIHDALAAVQPGDTLRIRVTPLEHDGYKLEVSGRTAERQVNYADAWSLLIWPESVARSEAMRRAMRMLWITLLAGPAIAWFAAGLRPARERSIPR